MPITNSHVNSEFRDIAVTDANGNVIGLDLQQVIIQDAANISIPGGANGQVIATDGAGNLYWTVPGSGSIIAPELSAGNSNIQIIEDGNINFSVTGVANIMTVSNVGVEINGNSVLPNIANVKIAGGANGSVLFSGVNNTLQWGGSQILLPEQGNSFGWVLANGLRIYRSGIGNVAGRVNSWRSGTLSNRPLSVPVLHDNMPPITRWLKIHMNVACLYALGDNGVLYSHGWDSQGQQGNSATNITNEVLTPITHPTLYGAGIRVVNFWSNDGTGDQSLDIGSVFVNVNDNGTMRTYAFGANYQGVLGLGNSTAQQVPVVIPQLAGKTIVNVSLQETNVLIVTADGQVWGAGYNAHGQLGLGNLTTPITTMSQATKSDGSFFTNAVKAWVMWAEGYGISTYVLCSDGSLWSCGRNLDGECGIGNTTANVTRFNRVAISNPITQFTCSKNTAAAIDNQFNMYGFGANYEGEWGIGGTGQATNGTPLLIQRNVKYIISLGRIRGDGLHSLAWIDTSNRTWAAGRNAYRMLGVNIDQENVTVAAPVFFGNDDEYCVEILPIGFANNNTDGAGWYVGTMWRTNLNRIYVSGRNSHACSLQRDNGTAFYTPVEITGLL